MKVLSLLQPWASLGVIGAKRIETRSWNTSYRGPLLIHASLRMSRAEKALCLQEPFLSALKASKLIEQERTSPTLNKVRWNLPLGAIIGKVNLQHIIASEEIYTGNGDIYCWRDHKWQFTKQEKKFGNYAKGRWLWLLSDPVQFEKPIPIKGQLQLWDYTGKIPEPCNQFQQQQQEEILYDEDTNQIRFAFDRPEPRFSLHP